LYARLIVGTETNAAISDYEGFGFVYDDDLTNVTGRVFFDVNGNGFFDTSTDYGLTGVTVTITDVGGPHTGATGTGGLYTIGVLLGDDTIEINESTVPVGAIVSTGGNPIAFTFTDLVLQAPDIGYTIEAIEDVAPDSVGNGQGTNGDTAYGGPGNDVLNGGGGDDWLVGGHWLGPGGACLGIPYTATILEDAGRPYPQFDPSILGEIGDRVFLDTNNDGRRQAGEPGVANIQVNLFDSTWQLVATTWTDVNGLYRFDKLNPTDYYVQFLAPAGFAFTTKDVSGNTVDTI